MTWTLIAHTSAVGTTPAINTTGADLIVVFVCGYGGAGTVSDSKGNAYTKSTAENGSLGQTGQISYLHGGTVGASHTFTSTASYYSINVLAFSGSEASPLDVQSAIATSTNSTTLEAGPVTPSQNNSLIIASVGPDTNTALPYAINDGFTITDSVVGAASVNEGSASAYLVQATAATISPTWNWTNSATAVALTAVFKPSAGSVGALTGTSAATSSATGVLAGKGTLTGTAAGTSTATGSPSGQGALTGASAAVSATTGTLAGHGTLSGASAATSTTTAALTGSGAVSGASAASSSASAALTGAGLLTGASAATSSATGILTAAGSGALTGASVATSAATGTLSGHGALSGTSAAGSSAAGTLTVVTSGALTGASVAVSAATGTLTGFGPISGVSAAGSSATGVLTALAPVYPPFTPAPQRTITGSIQSRFATGRIINRTI